MPVRPMSVRRLAALLALLVPAATSSLAAQGAPAATQESVLTLEEALRLARQNSPVYRNAALAQRNADAAVRSAYGAFTPSINTSGGAGFREGRQQFFGGVAFGAANDQLSTDVNASASMSLSMATVQSLRQARATQSAVEFDVAAAEQTLRADVTTQFIAALQAEARSVLQDTLLATTAAQLQLAEARFQVGAGTQLEVQRAQVANGQQQVAALNARNTAEIEKLRLFQRIGVEPRGGVRLEADLPVTLPGVGLDDLLEQARRANPSLEATKQREQAASRGVAAARSQYLPSMSLNANVSGFTQRFTDTDQLVQQGQAQTAASRASCIRSEEVRDAVGLPNQLAACDQIVFTDADAQAIRDRNSAYPFDFTRNPYSLGVSFSLPIFNGFRREQDVEQANVQRRQAENNRRQEELRVSTEVTSAYLTLTAQQQAVQLQEQNARTARTALSLAEERYRVGAINLVELIQSRTDYERAETDRISAVFDFQRAFTQLEAAVGRPLR